MGSAVDKLIPERIGIGTDWQSVVAGGSYTVALKVDGSLWAWGQNADGQLEISLGWNPPHASIESRRLLVGLGAEPEQTAGARFWGRQ